MSTLKDLGLLLALDLTLCGRDHDRAIQLLREEGHRDILDAAASVLVPDDQPACWIAGRLLALDLADLTGREARARVYSVQDLRVLRAAHALLNAYEGDERTLGWMRVRMAVLEAARHAERVAVGALPTQPTKTERRRLKAESARGQATLFPIGRAGADPFPAG